MFSLNPWPTTVSEWNTPHSDADLVLSIPFWPGYQYTQVSWDQENRTWSKFPEPHGSCGLSFVTSPGTRANIRETLHPKLLLSGHHPYCRGFLFAFCARKTTSHLTTFHSEGAFSSWPFWEYNFERQGWSPRALRYYAWFWPVITANKTGKLFLKVTVTTHGHPPTEGKPTGRQLHLKSSKEKHSSEYLLNSARWCLTMGRDTDKFLVLEFPSLEWSDNKL